ncbi:MAG TPA: peptidase M3, partial [Candidatus Sphingobacterium stercoripullorum]|nr:peptidase M3 [Candidatus Sphingobacterium stercoripullorum]
GFATTEYLAASFLDMGFHGITEPITTDASVVEKNAMEKIGLIDAIIPRYRSTYFQHVFSGGYSSGYYAYIWAEVLDADAFAAFKEKGIFDQETANAFRTEILELGATDNPAEMYKKFRGSDPNPVYLMKKRGLE